MKIILSSSTSNAFVNGAAAGFFRMKMLTEFHVPVAIFQGDPFDRLASIRPFTGLKRRKFEEQLKPFVRSWPWLELGRQISGKLGLSSLVDEENGLFNIDRVSKMLDRRVAQSLKKSGMNEMTGIYGYEDTVAFSFLAAKQKGIACLYDLPIGYWRVAHTLLEQERIRWPEWSATLTAFKDSAQKLARKEKELSLADHIFVASTFTAKTLSQYPGKLAPVHIIPYGFPPVLQQKRSYTLNPDHKLKILFVGKLSQRKGIADLFTVARELKDYVELTVVGQKLNQDCAILNTELKNHTWIPTLPHSDILLLMRHHDVLIFPSLFEGFGLVITEAMSQGTPVITTERTAGPDIIEHDRNGWLINAGSTDELHDAVIKLLTNRKKIASAGKEALETAAERPWFKYSVELAAKVSEVLSITNHSNYAGNHFR